MREAVLGKLVLVLSQATPEELAAVYRFATGEQLESAECGVQSAEWKRGRADGSFWGGTQGGSVSRPELGSGRPTSRPSVAASSAATAETPDPLSYTLRREAACWVLVFKGQRAYLKYELGLAYVAYLLSHPGEHVPSAVLFSKFSAGHRKDLASPELPDPETGRSLPLTDGVGIAQLRPDQDEAEAQSRYRAQLREYRETLADGSIPEPEREDARRLHDELLAFLKQHYRPEPDPGGDVTRVVHRSIQRLCARLRKPVAGQGVPDPVGLAIAEYIERHILVPSRRYTRAKAGANVRVARGELAGRLIFECPPDDQWSVHI
jgi:hypothetical protein